MSFDTYFIFFLILKVDYSLTGYIPTTVAPPATLSAFSCPPSAPDLLLAPFPFRDEQASKRQQPSMRK